jgi:hypothetical protein
MYEDANIVVPLIRNIYKKIHSTGHIEEYLPV